MSIRRSSRPRSSPNTRHRNPRVPSALDDQAALIALDFERALQNTAPGGDSTISAAIDARFRDLISHRLSEVHSDACHEEEIREGTFEPWVRTTVLMIVVPAVVALSTLAML